jgi:hypothetical protein
VNKGRLRHLHTNQLSGSLTTANTQIYRYAQFLRNSGMSNGSYWGAQLWEGTSSVTTGFKERKNEPKI